MLQKRMPQSAVFHVILLLTVFNLTPAQAWQGQSPMAYGYYQPSPPPPPRYPAYYPRVNYAPAYNTYNTVNPYRAPVAPYYPYPYPAPASTTSPVTIQKASITSPQKQTEAIQKPETITPDKPLPTDHKQTFIEQLLPHIEQENLRLAALRDRVIRIHNSLDRQQAIDSSASEWLQKLGKRYRIQGNPVDNAEARQHLLKKVDIIPASLALAQAANESGWGRSRFATEANNLYGIWTYDETRGLKPRQRDDDQKHLVRIFDHIGDSVRYYMHTLNSHPAYQKLRQIRAEARHNNVPLDGHAMAEGLEKYSGIGTRYIRIIQSMIRHNDWQTLDLDSPA